MASSDPVIAGTPPGVVAVCVWYCLAMDRTAARVFLPPGAGIDSTYDKSSKGEMRGVAPKCNEHLF
jgi:hypothetical protein